MASLAATVASNIRRIRLERGLSQEALAHLAGVHRNYPGLIERRKHYPSLPMLERLAKALQVEPIELLRPADDLRGPAKRARAKRVGRQRKRHPK